jgi:hypothetical protein
VPRHFAGPGFAVFYFPRSLWLAASEKPLVNLPNDDCDTILLSEKNARQTFYALVKP